MEITELLSISRPISSETYHKYVEEIYIYNIENWDFKITSAQVEGE